MDLPTHQNMNQFQPPQITNPPPQIFGGQSSDASPILPDFGFMDEMQDGFDQDGNHGDGNDAKRRRISRVGLSALGVISMH